MKDTLERLYKRSAYFMDAFLRSDILTEHEKNDLAGKRKQAANLSEFYSHTSHYIFNRNPARDIFNQLNDVFNLLNDLASIEEHEKAIFTTETVNVDKILEGFNSNFEEIEIALNVAVANLVSAADLTIPPEPESSLDNSTFDASYFLDIIENSNIPERSTAITFTEDKSESQLETSVDVVPIFNHLALYKNVIQQNIKYLKSSENAEEEIEICNNMLSNLNELASEELDIEMSILLLNDFVKAPQISENLRYLTQAFSQYLSEISEPNCTINDLEITEESFNLNDSQDDTSLNTAHDIYGMSLSSLGKQPEHTANPVYNETCWKVPAMIWMNGDETLKEAIDRICATERPIIPPVVDTTVQISITTLISGFDNYLRHPTSNEKKRKAGGEHLFFSEFNSNDSSEKSYSSSSDDESGLDPSDDESSDDEIRDFKSQRLCK